MYNNTECDTNLDLQSDMIIFESILTTFELGIIYWGSLGSKNFLESKT